MSIFDKKEVLPVEPPKHIVISTGNLHREYRVLDCIFAVDFNKQTWFKAANPADSFNGVKDQLAQRCRDLGGDAVISCQFQYRISTDNAVLSKQVAEIWAYGTAIKFI
ncbi:MAG: YbjQ family protein [Clostridiales bacterium]|nr:YbjQ family protein [Clostridiales bacterium]